MKNRTLDWLYLMGMLESIELIDADRLALYNEYDRVLNVREVILSDFKSPRTR